MNKDRFLWLPIVALIVCFWSMPVLAAKDTLSDEALDEITAAGDSQIAVAQAENGSADVNLVDNAQFTLSMPSNAQVGLRALTVQNVVGEVQLLVNLNVLSASNNVAGTDQRNFGVQSWGSTAPIAVATVAGKAAGDGGNGARGGDNTTATASPNISPVVGTACVAGLSGCTGSQTNAPTIAPTVSANASANAAPGGNGGNAAPGQIQIGLASGDGIAFATGNCPADNKSDPCAQADVVNNPNYNLSLQPNAQVNLATLFVANIVGRAQTIFNVNIASSTLNLIPDAGQPFTTPFQDATGVIKQVNSGVQFRGTPLGTGNTNANVTVLHTPN